MSAAIYQGEIRQLLAAAFGHNDVRSEWRIGAHARDAFADPESYVPRLDLAVGPFNETAEHAETDAARIHASGEHRLVRDIAQLGRGAASAGLRFNANPRCLLAIEVAFSGSRKHLLGDLTNASMMGLLGVVVGSSDTIGAVRRIAEYARRLRSVGKAPEGFFTNLVCVDAGSFRELLTSFVTSSTSHG